jgi:anti-sigma regulatory factor (Ser/Thr protein kinase)
MKKAYGEVQHTVNDTIVMTYEVPADDFTRAGEASSNVKSRLKQMGVAPDIIRKVSIALYEGEINMVIHADGGKIDVIVTPEEIKMILKDQGPGIENIDLAMQAGYSTAPDNIRTLGFGAGMGLPNMKKYTDELIIESTVGVGTTVTMKINMHE